MTELFKFDDAFVAKFAAFHEKVVSVNSRKVIDPEDPEYNQLKKTQFLLGKDASRIVRSLLVKHQIQVVSNKEPCCVELSNRTRIVKQSDGSVRIDVVLLDYVFDGEKGELTFIEGSTSSITHAMSGQPSTMSLMDIAKRLTAHVCSSWLNALLDYAIKQPLAAAGFSSDVASQTGACERVTSTAKRFIKNFFREKTIGSVVGAALWECVLDKAIFGFTIKAFGHKANLAHYNHVARNWATWQLYTEETPHLVRMIGAELTIHPYDYSQTLTTTMLQSMRERFFKLGGTQSGWSFLTRQSSGVLGHLWPGVLQCAGYSDAYSVRMLNRLGALRCKRLPYGRWLFYVFGSKPLMQPDKAKLNESLVWLTILLVNSYHARKLAASTILGVFRQIEDYLSSEDASVTKKSTYQGVLRKAETWHRQLFQQNIASRNQSNYQWQPLIQSLQVGSVSFYSLNTSRELTVEGQAMAHCVAGYGGQCFANRCRIYQVRVSGGHLATLEVRWNGRNWTLGQLYGTGNSPITSKKVLDAVKTLIRQCNKPSVKTLDPSLNIDFDAKAKEAAASSVAQAPEQVNPFGLNRDALNNEDYILAA